MPVLPFTVSLAKLTESRDEMWLPKLPTWGRQQPTPVCVAFSDFKYLSPPIPLLTVCTLFLQKFCYKTALNVKGSAVLARGLLPKITTTGMAQGKEDSTDQNTKFSL